jgi:hypothetical protein
MIFKTKKNLPPKKYSQIMSQCPLVKDYMGYKYMIVNMLYS